MMPDADVMFPTQDQVSTTVSLHETITNHEKKLPLLG